MQMIPGQEPPVYDGSKWWKPERYPTLAIEGHLAVVTLRNHRQDTNGGPPPYGLYITLFALQSAYDSVRLDSVRIVSSLGRAHTAFPSESLPMVRAVLPDSTPLPEWFYRQPSWRRCVPDCVRQRAGFYSELTVSPDMKRRERLSATIFVTLLSEARSTSGTLSVKFRPYVATHLFGWLTT
jgi:hypothetical protein